MIMDYIKVTLLATIAIALCVLAASQIFYYGQIEGERLVRINRFTGTWCVCNLPDTRWRSQEDLFKGGR